MSLAGSQKRTVLELLGELRPHWRRDAALPARIQAALARRKQFGSRDRRLYRELVYTALRALPWIEPLLDSAPDEAVRRLAHLCVDAPATRAFKAAFAVGDPPDGDRTELLPAWFRTHAPEIFADPELAAQLQRAPLWLRLQTEDPARVFAEFDALGWSYQASAVLPGALRLSGDVDVTKTDAWQAGLMEVQDLGSQLILAMIGIEPGGRWLDACAGAGGKTLQLARLLGAGGRIDAHDVRAAALEELVERYRRAASETSRLARVDTRTRLGDERYDGVLVDAPCSGSGTWRRSPHLKWVTTPEHIARAAETQQRLLAQFAKHVQPGGRLVYATCSLSRLENEAVIERFLGEHPEFQPAPFAEVFRSAARGAGRLILPAQHDTDGFFVASLIRA